MHRFKRLITAIILTVFSLILIFSAGFVYMIVTPLGGKILVRYFKKEFVSVGLMHVGKYQGTLQDGFILKDVRIKGLSYLPNAVLRIQEINVRLPLWNPSHSDFKIFNARIFIPGCDPIVFTGEIYGDQINGELFSNAVDLETITRFWATEDIKRHLQGFITTMDLKIKGPVSAANVKGVVSLDSIRYKSIVLTNLISRINFILSLGKQPFKMNGAIIVNSGQVKVRNVNLQLLQSTFIFKDDIYNPKIDINLGAKVEDMDFHLSLKGPSTFPELSVSSDPPMPAQQALQTLFTGNVLSSSSSPFVGVTSSQLAENFLDYSLQDMDEDQDFGLKTKLTSNLKLGAEMDQMPAPPGETNVYYSRKINGEMDLNEHMSLNVSQEVLPQDSYPSSYEDTDPQADREFYLQYKKRF